MARITASVYTSHVPAIGAALDLGKAGEPYWQPLFKGYEPSKQWKIAPSDIAERKLWKEYRRAYEECLAATSSKPAPWWVVPADDKNNARLLEKGADNTTEIKFLHQLGGTQWPYFKEAINVKMREDPTQLDYNVATAAENMLEVLERTNLLYYKIATN